MLVITKPDSSGFIDLLISVKHLYLMHLLHRLVDALYGELKKSIGHLQDALSIIPEAEELLCL